MRSVLAVCLLLATAGASAAVTSEQAAMWLEAEDPARWDPAVEALLADGKARLPREALSSVLKRLDALAPAQRARVALGLRGRLDERRVRDALSRLLADSREEVRNAAVAALTGKLPIPVDSAAEAGRINTGLARLLAAAGPEADAIAAAIASLYVREHAAALGVATEDVAAFRPEAARRSLTGTRADPYFGVLSPHLEATDWRTRGKAFQAFSLLIDERVDRRLLELTRHPNQHVAGDALETLASRGARRPAEPPRAIAAGDRGRTLTAAATALAAAFMAATLLLAAATFLWGFRLLQVRRLLRHLGVSKARSLAPGLVSLQGEVQPVEDAVLVHPETEQPCVYYDGAERATPAHRFWLVDDSGRVLVEPRGAVLLSEDRTLVAGERVRVIATAQRLSRADSDARAPTVLRAGKTAAGAYARIGRRLLQAVMDGHTTRLLFSDPRRMLLIWDDAHDMPFTSARETALMFASFALAATWVLLFVAAMLVLADQRFAAALGL